MSESLYQHMNTTLKAHKHCITIAHTSPISDKNIAPSISASYLLPSTWIQVNRKMHWNNIKSEVLLSCCSDDNIYIWCKNVLCCVHWCYVHIGLCEETKDVFALCDKNIWYISVRYGRIIDQIQIKSNNFYAYY